MISYQSHLDTINTELPQMKDLLIRWSGINSGSRHLAGLEKMKDALVQTFQKLGAQCEQIELKAQKIVNHKGEIIEQKLGKALRFTKRPEAPLQVFLGGHYDTVFGEHHPFQEVREIDNNTLNGPGVADLKGGLIVIFKALQALEKSERASQIGWEVLINPDEEIGSPGSTYLFEEAAKKNHVGLIFEPSLPDGTIVGQRKGSGNFDIVIRGKAAHAGREHHLGRSAILALAKVIQKLEALNGVIPDMTLNVGIVEGGSALNTVPDLAIGRFNIRFAKTEDTNDIKAHVQNIIDEANTWDGIQCELYGDLTRAPKIVTEDIQKLFSHYNACAKEEGFELHMKPTGGVCDGNTLAAFGLANLDTLGVRGGKIHSSDEYILLDSMVERARLTARFLLKLAYGEIKI